jgi:hypothetical protein
LRLSPPLLYDATSAAMFAPETLVPIVAYIIVHEIECGSGQPQ